MGLTLATFGPALRCDFVNFDDPDYVTSNPQVQGGLTLEGVKWAFSHAVSANWHPLTLISHMLDCQIYGLKPWGHHLTNVLLHTLNTVLVFLLFRNLTGATWRSFWVAALFGWHPVHVESVAWVAERKDVLSGCFGLLTLIFYTRYVQNKESRKQKAKTSGRSAIFHLPSSIFYLLTLSCFALGLMSKPMLVTWPFVLLLLDYWPLNRMQNAKCEMQNAESGIRNLKMLVVEKIPFCALAVAASAVALIVQAQKDAVQSLDALPLDARCENAVISYVRYLGKLCWPTNLSVYYILPGNWPLVLVLAAAVLLAGITWLVWWQRRRYPFLLTGWLWYGGTLVPVIGLVQVGAQAMADRYTYLPSLGVLLMVVWGIAELVRRYQALLVAASVAGAGMLLCCLGSTRQQLTYWQNGEILFRHALAVTDRNYISHNNLGHAFSLEGRWDEAIAEYQEAIRLKFDYAQAHANLGTAFDKKGRLDEAIGQFQKAIHFRPDYALYHYNLGVALIQHGQTNEAMDQYHEAIRLNPDDILSQYNLGLALYQAGRLDEAIDQFQKTMRLKPDDASVHYSLGLAFDAKGQIDNAILQYQEAIRFQPEAAEHHHFLGVDLGKKGDFEEAIHQLQEAVRLNPADAETHNDLGNVLDSQGQTDEAIRQYQESIRLRPESADAHGNLGAAYGKKGDLEGAILQLQEALRLQPDDPLGHYNLGQALDQKGRPDDAIREYREALRLKPDFAEAHANLEQALKVKNTPTSR